MTPHNLIALSTGRAFADLAQQMLAAAQASQWTELSQASERLGALRLQVNEAQLPPLNATQAEELVDVIQNALNALHQAECLALSHMQAVSEQLGEVRRLKQCMSAYGRAGAMH